MSLALVFFQFVFAAMFSAILTWLARRYALRRQLLDLPGHRRSHTISTPRGGGIGPVLSMLAGGVILERVIHGRAPELSACLIGVTAVAAIGWLDDHRPLSAGLRILVHVAAAVLVVLAILGVPTGLPQAFAFTIAILWIVGLTNAWNFMDGIDGLASSQAVLLAGCMVAGAAMHGWLDPAWSAFALIVAGATTGFLPFNFPRARIFLGDVGSGTLGFVLACLLLRAVARGGMRWPLVPLLVSAFLIDSGLTLVKRMSQGRAWWRPHREHLYQWLVRGGWSHASVTLLYAAWSLASCLVVLAMASLDVFQSAEISAGALLSTALLWGWAKERVWINARTSNKGMGRR